MKKLLLILAACLTIVAGCKGGTRGKGSETAASEESIETTADTKVTAAAEGFTFDELFRIFSCFGDNILSDKFASQRAKDGIKDELRSSYNGYTEFVGPCNWLSCDLFDGDCYDGFRMACYRYKADGHILVVLLEDGGCDVSSVKYIRYYEYDPAQDSAHEIPSPFDKEPEPDDFEDMIRLAGSDVQALRGAMRAGLLDYDFRADGLRVRLNDPMDFDEQVYHGDLVVDYLWNGSMLVRNKDYRYACIHPDGFASIKLGERVPDFNFDYDPKDYDAVYSTGGELWIISRDGKDGLQVQLNGDDVYSVEVWLPEYCVASYAYDPGAGKVQPYVGCRINDCINLDVEGTEVAMLMDGTVQIECPTWNSRIAFRTSRESLVNAPQPSMNGRQEIANPKFKDSAKIESILVWRE